MEPLCLVLSDDLLDASRIIGEAREVGIQAIQCRDSATLLIAASSNPRIVVLDLHNPGLEVANVVGVFRTTGAKFVGFGSHVDATRLKAARTAGCDEVLPRSAFFQDLGSRLAQWAKPN
jgi:AmiR/NasT family two-component response regulator